MRKYVDPTRHYRGNDNKNKLPTHFHVGYELAPGESFNSKKKKKYTSYMDDVIQDSRLQDFTYKKYREVGSWGENATRYNNKASALSGDAKGKGAGGGKVKKSKNKNWKQSRKKK